MAGSIAVDVPLALAPQVACESLQRAMQTIGKSAGPRIEFSLFLHDLHVAIAGALNVPVTLDVISAHERAEYTIHIHAAADEGFFPTFAGILRIVPLGHASVLHMEGEYEPPFGAVGALLDKTVLRHAAERSLKSFLERIASDILEATRRT
jgi:hypothetical protein